MNEKLKSPLNDYLFKAILSLRTVEECYDFFEDLCTISEIQEMSKRLNVAQMLMKNVVYTDIVEQSGLSTATISRVNRCLKYGTDGYSTIIKRIENDEK
ncbi:MAG: YerC/YecD family TrpR-related protein [Firmicutes bacterium]|nr:YerC/YecD family TrpR-related protein [Bacillota bacterium]